LQCDSLFKALTNTEEIAMKNVLLWTLIVANALLLLSFADRLVRHNTAQAQIAGIRRPGDYLEISGSVNGSTAGLLYVVDTVNGQLTAMTYGQAGLNSQIQSMPPIDLSQVFAEQPVQTRSR
jgi:hypothetical protein